MPARILLGFLSATAFVSLWISNTATEPIFENGEPTGALPGRLVRGRPA